MLRRGEWNVDMMDEEKDGMVMVMTLLKDGVPSFSEDRQERSGRNT